jgi:hypothetical protein
MSILSRVARGLGHHKRGGSFGHPKTASSGDYAWLGCKVITHNLPRAACTLACGNHAVTWSTPPPATGFRPQTNPAPISRHALAQRMENPRHNILG